MRTGRVGLAVMVAAVVAGSQTLPHHFTPQTVARADSVNANFGFLLNQITTLNARCDSVNTALRARCDSLAALKPSFPIGTVIASLRKPLAGGYLPGDSTWVLADGTPDVDDVGYRLDYLSGDTPDLRGVFLRGLNEGRTDGMQDPEGTGRTAGTSQADQFKSHEHRAHWSNAPPVSGGVWYDIWSFYGPLPYSTCPAMEAAGGSETRPKNVAVYYYVKVR